MANFPLDNLTFDLITILYEKSKGLEAYDRYLKDAQSDQELAKVLDQIRNDDRKHIELLRQHLGRVLGSQQGRKVA